MMCSAPGMLARSQASLGTGQRRLHVQFAGAQPAQRRFGIGGGKIIHRVDLHAGRVIKAGIS